LDCIFSEVYFGQKKSATKNYQSNATSFYRIIVYEKFVSDEKLILTNFHYRITSGQIINILEKRERKKMFERTLKVFAACVGKSRVLK
jgi:hypothetical protein